MLLAIVLASGTIACLGVNRANRRQQDDLVRVVATLTDATFPLSKDVLRQMSGLSGAEFVVFDAERPPPRTHLAAGRATSCESLRRLPEGSSPMLGGPSGMVLRQRGILSAEPSAQAGESGKPSQSPVISGRTYLAWRMPVTRRGTAVRPDWLVVLYPEDQWWSAARQAVYPALLTGAAAALAVIAITTILARRFVRPIQELGQAGGGDRPGAVPTGGRRSPRRRDPRSDPVDQPHGGDARPLRAVGPPERTLADARAAWRRHGPSTPQFGHRGVDGRRTAPAAVSRPGRTSRPWKWPSANCD